MSLVSVSSSAKPQVSVAKDVLQQISRYLPPEEVGRCIRVSRAWKTAFDDKCVWNWQADRVGLSASVQAQEKTNARARTILESYSGDGSGHWFARPLLDIVSEYYIGNAKEQFINPYPAIAFGRQEWLQHVGDPGEVPRLPTSIHDILRRQCPFWPDKTIGETHLLVLIPKTVTKMIEGSLITVPLTLKTLDQLVKAAHGGTDVHCRRIQPEVETKHGNEPMEKSHWVLMPKDVLPESRGHDYALETAAWVQRSTGLFPGSKGEYYPFQKKLVENAGRKVPSALVATTAILMEHLRSGIHLFGREPYTYIRCRETFGDWQVVTGGFSQYGWSVHVIRDNWPSIGIVGVEEFF